MPQTSSQRGGPKGCANPNTTSRTAAARSRTANGLRLVVEEHRTTTTPKLRSGKPGKTKVIYGEVDDANKWLWKFLAEPRYHVRSPQLNAARPRPAGMASRWSRRASMKNEHLVVDKLAGMVTRYESSWG